MGAGRAAGAARRQVRGVEERSGLTALSRLYAGIFHSPDLMKTKIIPFDFTLRDGSGRRMGEGREPGLHLSDVLNAIEKAEKGKDRFTTNFSDVWAGVGFMWEIVIAKTMPLYFAHDIAKWVIPVPQMKKDGIWMSPDGYDAHAGILHEYKASWQSIRKLDNFPRNFARWLRQVKAYCHAMELDEALIVALFLGGDWFKTNDESLHGPLIRQIHCSFRQWELEENWQMILNHARDLR